MPGRSIDQNTTVSIILEPIGFNLERTYPARPLTTISHAQHPIISITEFMKYLGTSTFVQTLDRLPKLKVFGKSVGGTAYISATSLKPESPTHIVGKRHTKLTKNKNAKMSQ